MLASLLGIQRAQKRSSESYTLSFKKIIASFCILITRYLLHCFPFDVYAYFLLRTVWTVPEDTPEGSPLHSLAQQSEVEDVPYRRYHPIALPFRVRYCLSLKIMY